MVKMAPTSDLVSSLSRGRIEGNLSHLDKPMNIWNIGKLMFPIFSFTCVYFPQGFDPRTRTQLAL